MRKAEGQARDVEAFRARMDEAKIDAQKAIENMYDAEREAERARLEAASATATLGAVRKTKEVETLRNNKLNWQKRSKRLRKEARKKQEMQKEQSKTPAWFRAKVIFKSFLFPTNHS